MRILIVTGIFPPDIGGPATYVPLLADALRRRGHAPTVITMSDAPAAAAPVLPFPVVRLSRRPWAVWRWVSGVAAVVRAARRTDVILAAGLLVQCAVANLVVRKPLAVRAVSDLAWDRATAYGWLDEDLDEFHRRRHALRIEGLKLLQAWALRRADLVIVPSRWLAGWVAREGVRADRVRVIPNATAIPFDTQGPSGRTLRGTPMIAAVGRLVPVKRMDRIIRAVAQLPAVRLRIIGDGPQRGALARLAVELGLSDRVEFAGRQDHVRALRLLADSDALVISSAHEGFPHVILEAMALAVPVIAPSAGGIPELIDDGRTGLLIDGSVGGITAALRRLFETPGLAARLGAQARGDVHTRFDPVRMAEATLRALQDAAAMRIR
ncbi:MAG TPA: glycosyltransferase family 4 protein [bacterium]|nr:glycosyltransferase family 4 protein [bacterium]